MEHTTADNQTGSGSLSLRDRLQGLMFFRVALVTVLLGGTIAVDIETLASLSDPRNVALLSLIVGTYLLTIAYAVLLDRLDDLVGLARFQLVADFLLASLLVLFTYGLDSIFLFIFYLNIINTAIVAGRRPALYVAGATSAILFVMGVLATVDLSHPLINLEVNRAGLPPIYFEVLVDAVAAFLIAFLAGQLSERLGERTVELKQKRHDLARLRALTDNILSSLNSGLLTVDDDREIIYFNRAAGAITGVDPDEADGRPLAEVFPEIHRILQEKHVADSPPETPPPGKPDNPRFELAYTRPDGESVFLGFSISVLRNSSGQPAGQIVVFQDLTEIKRLEAAKQRSERLAAVGELAASIAHEIRNPLASISGSVEMLESVADLDAQDRSLMNIILREVDRLDSLISEFMDYSRPSSMSFDAADLAELVTEVVELFDQRDSSTVAGVDVRTDPEEADWRAEIDRESIRQVLWNLLNNASDALEGREVDPPAIRVTLGRRETDEQTYLSMTVEDAGPGLPDAERDRIFEPFFTTKEHGSGLGLATSHRLIEAHGGRIQIGESETLGGAEFTVWLPESPDRPVEVDEPSADAPATRPGDSEGQSGGVVTTEPTSPAVP